MKKLFVAGLLTFLATSAFAKITIFTEADAIDAVLSDEIVMANINSKVSGDLINSNASSSGTDADMAFTVRLTFASSTPIGLRSCYIDVDVKSEIVKHQIGNSTIVSSELSVKEISDPICQK